MKKIIPVIFIVLVTATLYKINNNQKTTPQPEIKPEEIRAIYISYIELSKYLDNTTANEKKEAIAKIVTNLKEDGFNWILLHTRSFSDSIYPSQVFPTAYLITRNEKEELEFDILQEFIEKAHQENLQIHAWINPYRIRNESDFSTITPANPCFKWMGTNNMKQIDGTGIFYNPASEEVRKLIIEGIKEILENYQVDGIHFDDYFYPDATIDLENYQEYKKEGGTLTLEEYRLENVNILIRDVYKLIKKQERPILFGIAPDGNIENNYHKNYADIDTWLSKNEYLDYIMPQIYYGFQNQTKPYTQTINEWNGYIKNSKVKLIPALALYKSGNMDEYALAGKEEWIEHSNIITNQVKIARNLEHYAGFAIFRYDNIYAEQNENMMQEVKTLRTFLEK